jgi:hypothetical protein
MPYNRRRESQSHVEAIATPKQPQSQSSRGAAGGSGDVVVTLDASCAKEGRIEEIQTKEIKHMIKSPWLEAWKKGVVPMLEPQKTSDDGEGANVEGGNEAIGSALWGILDVVSGGMAWCCGTEGQDNYVQQANDDKPRPSNTKRAVFLTLYGQMILITEAKTDLRRKWKRDSVEPRNFPVQEWRFGNRVHEIDS